MENIWKKIRADNANESNSKNEEFILLIQNEKLTNKELAQKLKVTPEQVKSKIDCLKRNPKYKIPIWKAVIERNKFYEQKAIGTKIKSKEINVEKTSRIKFEAKKQNIENDKIFSDQNKKFNDEIFSDENKMFEQEIMNEEKKENYEGNFILFPISCIDEEIFLIIGISNEMLWEVWPPWKCHADYYVFLFRKFYSQICFWCTILS